MKKYEYIIVAMCTFLFIVGMLIYENPELNLVGGKVEPFIKGADISSLISLEESGVKFYDFDGNEEDLVKILADNGFNYLRLRVWNNPYDENGNGYGGGNSDVSRAIILGRRAAENGMKTFVDYHYSDFFADPGKQMAPKAWKNMTISEKEVAVYRYTLESLCLMIEAGVDVGMVQIGNEINYGLAGESGNENVDRLLVFASKAVRDVSDNYGMDIKVAIHYTNIANDGEIKWLMDDLTKYQIDYDVIALSYYPYWHGTLENLTEITDMIKNDYGKDVVIAETSYCYTTKDGDGSANSISNHTVCEKEYPTSVEGQTKYLTDILDLAKDNETLGVFYWEPAWIPVGDDRTENEKLWEKYGSGWASSYAGSYDPDDAGKYYGGSSWDNQALFDFTGHPLESLKLFKKY